MCISVDAYPFSGCHTAVRTGILVITGLAPSVDDMHTEVMVLPPRIARNISIRGFHPSDCDDLLGNCRVSFCLAGLLVGGTNSDPTVWTPVTTPPNETTINKTAAPGLLSCAMRMGRASVSRSGKLELHAAAVDHVSGALACQVNWFFPRSKRGDTQ